MARKREPTPQDPNDPFSSPHGNLEGMPVITWQEQLAHEAKRYQETGSISHDFAEELKTASQEERARFQALIEQNRERSSRVRRGTTQEEDPMLHEDIFQKQARNRLHTVINKGDTRKRGQQQGSHFVTNSIGETTEVPTWTKVTPETVQKQTARAVTERLVAQDPVTGERKLLVPEEMVGDFRRQVHESYFGISEAEKEVRRKAAAKLSVTRSELSSALEQSASIRTQARRRAESLANRMSQRAGEQYQNRAETAKFAQQAEKIFGSTYKPSFRTQEEAQYVAKKEKIQKSLSARGLQTEQRLGGTFEAQTAADLYSQSGYESKSLQRTRHELKAIQGRAKAHESFQKASRFVKSSGENKTPIGGEYQASLEERLQQHRANKPTNEPKPKLFNQTRQQLHFNREQAKTKVNAAREGTLNFGIDSSGHVVEPGSKSAVVRVGPNRVWKYTVNARDKQDPTKKRSVTLPYWDKTQQFDRGSSSRPDEIAHRRRSEIFYDEKGTPYPVEQHVLNERLVRKWEYPVNAAFGERELKGSDEKLPNYVSKQIFVPVKGASRASKLVNDPDESYEIKQIRSVSGRWFEATPEEWSLARQKGEVRGSLGSSAYPTRTVQVPKKIKVTYVDPSQLHLKRNEKDTLAFTLPGKKLSPEFRQKLIDRSLIDQNQYKVGERAVEVNLGEGRLNDFLLAPVRAQQEISLRKKSKITAMSKELGVAGATAAYYAQLERTRKGYIPNKVNKGYEGALQKSPGLKKWAQKHSLDDVTLPVEEAYVRPGLEKARNLGYQLRHPTASLEGTSQSGVDFGSVYFRQHFISPDKKEYRQVVKTQRKLDRVTSTQGFVEKNYTARGLRGKIARWQAEPLQRHEDYREFYPNPTSPATGFLAQTIREAREAKQSNPSGSDAYQAAIKLERQSQQLMREEMQRRAESARNPNRHPVLRSDINKKLINPPKGPRIRLPELTPTERKAALGGAAVATAVGAHYAYHKYEQGKLTPENRTAYYNKVIPGPVRVNTPYVRATGHYRIPPNTITNEFGLTNKRMPMQWGAGLKTKTLWKGSPADRGYPKNAKIGILGVRGSGTKVKGSLKGSVVYNPDSVFTRKRSFRPSGQQVVVAGHKMPLKAQVSSPTPVRLSRTNPNRLTQADRENLIWAFKGHPEEDEVREFFAHGRGDRVLDMFDDPKIIQKIRRQRGEIEGRRLASTSYVAPSLVGTTSEDPVEDFRALTEKDLAFENIIHVTPGGVLHIPKYKSRGASMATGGTGGIDPYSQLGQRRTKHDEAFIEGVGWVRTERPIGSRGVDLPAANIPGRGNPRHHMEQRPRKN